MKQIDTNNNINKYESFVVNTVKFGLFRFRSIKWDRVTLLFVLLSLGGLMILWRLYSLQVVNHHFYEAMAAERFGGQSSSKYQRGSIYVEDKDEESKLFPLGIDEELNLVYAVPSNIKEPARDARKIAKVLGLDAGELEDKLRKKDDPYEPIINKISNEVVEELDGYGIIGLGFSKERWRYYPSEDIFSHLVGFVGFSDNQKKGLYGVEGFYDDILSEENNQTTFWSSGGTKAISDLVLTVDRGVQYTVCKKLSEYVDRMAAKSGSVIILEPSTGYVIAMCNYPSFNPNKYNEVEDIQIYNNASIFDTFEPGSTFKTITMAAALDTGAVKPDDVYIDEGFIKIGKDIIENYDRKGLGEQSMTQILENSLNTGAIYVAEAVGFDKFKEYLLKFGFGHKTGIDLNYESRGDLSTLDKKSDIYLATASFGQGITSTPLQMVVSYAAIANQGKLMKPMVIKRIIDSNGYSQNISPTMVNQVVTPRTATLLSGMLVAVVNNGHGKLAGVDGYYLAGKTGTAQVHDVSGGYSDKTVHSFVGFGPVDNPVFAMITKLDEVENTAVAAGSAAPLFGEIAKFLLEYYEVPKDY